MPYPYFDGAFILFLVLILLVFGMLPFCFPVVDK